MNVNNLLRDSDAVSPVIGVILMVAITVIMAAIVGAFALQFDASGETPPAAVWNSHENPSAGYVNFTHDGGEDIHLDTLEPGVNVDAVNATDDPLRTGSELLVDVDASSVSTEDDVTVVWRPPSGGQTHNLLKHTLRNPAW